MGVEKKKDSISMQQHQLSQKCLKERNTNILKQLT